MTSAADDHKDCVFCSELGGSRDTNFAKRYPEIDTRIVGESQSLVAFPCIGQLSPGHFLVVPKHHHTTFRETSKHVSDLQVQFQILIKEVHSLLDMDDYHSLYFEHGAERKSHGGCGIYHAHIHVVPNAGHIELRSHFLSQVLVRSESMMGALNNLPGDAPYAMYGSITKGFFSHGLKMALPSQTLRRVVAHELTTSTWDWRETGREAGMLNMLQKAMEL